MFVEFHWNCIDTDVKIEKKKWNLSFFSVMAKWWKMLKGVDKVEQSVRASENMERNVYKPDLRSCDIFIGKMH